MRSDQPLESHAVSGVGVDAGRWVSEKTRAYRDTQPPTASPPSAGSAETSQLIPCVPQRFHHSFVPAYDSRINASAESITRSFVYEQYTHNRTPSTVIIHVSRQASRHPHTISEWQGTSLPTPQYLGLLYCETQRWTHKALFWTRMHAI